MKLFIDTANVAEIKKIHEMGILDGVTTNPTLIAREGANLEKRIREICKIVDGPVSSEVIGTKCDEMVAEGRKMAAWAKNVYVKIPMTIEGLKAVKILSAEGIKTNVTLIFSVNQALLAAKAGASFVSPFVGRLDDTGADGIEIVSEIVQVFENYGLPTEVLAASIRHTMHVQSAAAVGADIATIPAGIFEKMTKHPLTDAGLAAFAADWAKVADKN